MNLLFFNITIIIIVIGLILPELFHNEFGHYIKRLPSNINRSLILVLVAFVAILNYFNDSRNSIENNRTTVSTNVADSTVSSTSITEADYSSTTTSTTETMHSSIENSSVIEQSSSNFSLLDLNFVKQQVNDDIDLDKVENLQANGDIFERALTYGCSLYCDGTSPQIREYVLGRKYSNLTAKLVVLDSSSDTHTVTFKTDNGFMETYTVEPGFARDVNISVSDVARLRIEFHSPNALKSPLQAGVDSTQGLNGGGLPGIALADPILIK